MPFFYTQNTVYFKREKEREMKFKKLLAKTAVSAAVMAMALCPASVSASTQASSMPSAEDTQTIAVTNIEHGATVKAYKIADAGYSSAGLTGYETVAGVSIADLEEPTLEEVQAITCGIQDGSLVLPALELSDVTPADSHQLGDGSSECTYRSGDLGAGMYLVLVKGVSGNIYNPAIVSIGYDNESKICAGSLDMSTGSWTVTGGVTEVKHSKVTVTKETEDGIRSFSYNDTIDYVVTTAIPSYDESVYKNVTFRMVDTADPGLTFNESSVSVEDAAGTVVDKTNYEVSLTGQTLTVDFKSAWVLSHGGTSVTIKYEGILNEDAGLDFQGNYNRVKIVYSNDPSSQGGSTAYDDSSDPGSPKAESVVYSFDLSFTKVDSKDSELALPGAEFSLTGTNTTGDDVSYLESSNDDGIVHFSGLSEGTYTMRETKAPKGYAVNQNTYTVTISPVYGSDKTLSSYTVTITDQDGNDFMNKTYTSTPLADGKDGNIPNTAFKNLPATGGTGTVIYSIIGITAIIAGTILVTGRRASRPEKG